MKAAQIAILLIVIIALMNWVRSSQNFALPTVLPWLGGDKPSIYDFAALAMIIIAILGLRGSTHKKDNSDE